MATKIYLSGGAINIEGVYPDKSIINPVQFDWSVNNGVYSARDKIDNQTYILGIYSNIQNKDGVAYTDNQSVEEELNNLVNAGNSSASSPVASAPTDVTGNQGLMSTFGDVITASRIPSLTSQFFYGLVTGGSNPVADDAIITELNGATVGIVDGELILNTGTNAAGAATIQSNDFVRYIPGFEMYCLFTWKFTQGVADSTQYAGLFDAENGFFIGYNGVNFVFTRRKDSVDYETVIDVSKVFEDGSFDPTKFNIYFIRYGFLGVAPIKLSVVKPSGGFAVVDTIEYPNMYDGIHTAQTYLPVRAELTNTGNITDLEGKSGSVSAGIVDGMKTYPSNRLITSDLGAITIGAGTTLLALFRNKTTFNSIVNRIKTKLLSVSTASEGTKTVKIEIRKNVTITNTPTWNDVETGRSVMEFSTDGTINLTSGTDLIDFNLGRTDSLFQLLGELDLTLRAGEWAAIIATSTGASDLEYSMRWEEQF
jgi:hypothetical protein